MKVEVVISTFFMSNLIFENLEIRKFIEDHKSLPIADVILKIHNKKIGHKEFIVNQINAYQKLKHKLPFWADIPELIYPSIVSFEQCSSSETALFKATILKENCNHIIDITGGFGIDTYYLSQKCREITHVERNKELSEIVQHNFQKLNVENCKFVIDDSIEYLRSCKVNFDLLYVDPARRDSENNKVVLVNHCEPNLYENFELFKSKSKQILAKFSPMLDIHHIISELKPQKIFIVSVKNECKEILVFWDFQTEQEKTLIDTINIHSSLIQMNSFEYKSENLNINYQEPQLYIYEPNSSIMKSGCVDQLAKELNLPKLHPNTHLFTSEFLIKNFPGRIYKVITPCTYSEKSVKKYITDSKAQITTRNFGESVEEIRKKLKLKDGGDKTIIATSSIHNKKLILLTERILQV